MVGHPPLRKIIGADAFRPVARSDLAASLCGTLGIEPLALALIEAGAQNLQGFRLVLVLRFLVLLGDDQACRDVGDPDCAVRRVDRLSAWTGRTIDVDAQ